MILMVYLIILTTCSALWLVYRAKQLNRLSNFFRSLHASGPSGSGPGDQSHRAARALTPESLPRSRVRQYAQNPIPQAVPVATPYAPYLSYPLTGPHPGYNDHDTNTISSGHGYRPAPRPDTLSSDPQPIAVDNHRSRSKPDEPNGPNQAGSGLLSFSSYESSPGPLEYEYPSPNISNLTNIPIAYPFEQPYNNTNHLPPVSYSDPATGVGGVVPELAGEEIQKMEDLAQIDKEREEAEEGQ